MNSDSEFELDKDLQLLPEWARQPSTGNKYAGFRGSPDDDPGAPRRGRRDFGRNRDRDRGRERRSGPPPRGEGRPGPGRAGGPGPGDRARSGRDFPRGDFPRGRGSRPPRSEPEIPLPEVDVRFIPEEKGVESLARQIKLTGRAYPLFEIAALVLRRPERYRTEFAVQMGPDSQPKQRLWVCSLDDSVWLSEDELVAHALRKHFDTFYQTEKIPTDPPKGTYTFVAKCGMSGVILGPPNYHDYQRKLRELHAERFARMPFEAFKSRIEIVKDEAVVKQWLEDQSYRTEFICLNVPEPQRLANRAEVEAHFRETHLPNLMKSVDTASLPHVPERRTMSHALNALIRRSLDQQRRFPLKLATELSQQFANHGLQFFKVNKTVTHVCVARPHFLDLETTLVSDGVRRIVDFINAREGCTRRTLLESLAPEAIARAQAASAAAAAPAAAEPPSQPAPEPVPPGEAPADQAAEAPSGGAPAAPETGAPAAPAASPEPTPEQTAIISDLHWLIHQGHVIEFSDGRMETAKKPKPKPERPRLPKPAAPKADAARATATPASPEEPVAATQPESATPPAPSTTAEHPGLSGSEPPAPADPAPAPAEPTPATQPVASEGVAPQGVEKKPIQTPPATPEGQGDGDVGAAAQEPVAEPEKRD